MIVNNLKDTNVEENSDVCFISIVGGSDAHMHYFKQNHSNVLNVEFDDLAYQSDFGLAITDEIAKVLYDFINSNIHRKTYVIHCMAGVSRSAAVGQFIDDIFGSLDFKVLNPQICPNKLVYALLLNQHNKELLTNI
jgi:predicted protein tyrosine phosphatase